MMGFWDRIKKGFGSTADLVIPRPDLHYKASQRHVNAMFDNIQKGDYALAIGEAGGYLGHGILTVGSILPGVSGATKIMSRLSRSTSAVSKSTIRFSNQFSKTPLSTPSIAQKITKSAIVSRSYGRSDAVKMLSSDKTIPSSWKPFLKAGRNPYSGKGSKAVARALNSSNPNAQKWARGQMRSDGKLKTIRSGYDLAHAKGSEYHITKYNKQKSAESWYKARFKDRSMHQFETKLQNKIWHKKKF